MTFKAGDKVRRTTTGYLDVVKDGVYTVEVQFGLRELELAGCRAIYDPDAFVLVDDNPITMDAIRKLIVLENEIEGLTENLNQRKLELEGLKSQYKIKG